MEIIVIVIIGIAVLGLLGMLALAGFLLSQAIKLLHVAASTPPQPESHDRRQRRKEPWQEESQEFYAAGALRRKHAKGEA